MAPSGRSEFVDFTTPLYERLNVYDPLRSPQDQPRNDATDPAHGVPQGFIDSMIVREAVFVHEQDIPLANEFDDDDPKSFHWVAYASIPNKPSSATHSSRSDNELTRVPTSTKIPIGTIRLVPPPHLKDASHSADSLDSERNTAPALSTKYPVQYTSTSNDAAKEAYIKIGRLAVIPEFRKTGISKLLIETALGFARDNPYEVEPQLDPSVLESLKKGKGIGVHFKGLCLIHAQRGVQKVWQRYGFERDDTMGVWLEEGIEHVGMWRRLDVADARQRGKIRLPSSAGLSGSS